MTDDEAEFGTSASIYAARAARKARKTVICGVIGAALALAMFLFLLLVPASSGRDYPVLILMAAWTTAGVFFAVRGYGTLCRARGDQQPG